MLYPRESESREVKELAGIWRFQVDKNNEGFEKRWYEVPLTDTIPMPVPSSYNDLTQDTSIRDHVGYVWYEKVSYAPASWTDKRVILRFGGVAHKAEVWVNGNKVMGHVGGFLPFETDVTDKINVGKENRITVAVSNELDHMHLPHGNVETFNDDKHPEGYKRIKNHGDYYPFGGIQRYVKLYTTPKDYIEDITVTTDIEENTGIINYSVCTSCKKQIVKVTVLDKNGQMIGKSETSNGIIAIPKAQLWCPGKSYLYNMIVQTFDVCNCLIDSYKLPVGIRTIKVQDSQFLINGEPFFFRGFGKHEDSPIRGRGFDNVINVKDFNLLKWLGANSFRTSHYPYAEEIIQLADQEGIVIIGESPALSIWIPETDENKEVYDCTIKEHKQAMKELIDRDKNSPSVVIWSVANEVLTKSDASRKYFKEVIKYTRELDATRPITIVECVEANETKVSDLVDIVSVNRYFSWYEDSGCLELIKYQLEKDLTKWYERFKKPVFLTEFGADAIAGIHQDPPVMFSEEYQKVMIEYFLDVCDNLHFMIGTHVWAFADFATHQGVGRVDGNKKGVLTRDRRPKLAAHYLHQRWN